MVYGLGLIVVNTAAFLWLFGRAPQYRWPVVIMLSGEVLSRALWFTSSGLFPAWNRIDSDIAAVIVVWAAYAVALFGFRILDPLSAARQTVIQQMREGMMVVDGSGRVVNLNPAAEAILGETGARLRGKTWRQALRLPSDAAALEPSALPSELTLTTGDISREYTLDLSPLKDPRGLDVGSLLLLLDVTEQRRAQAQAQQQQRALAVVHERERLARELHDDLGQVIGFVNTQGQAARRLLGHGEVEAADALLARLVEVAQEADTDLRESILGLRVAVDERGLLSAVSGYLAQYEKRYGIRTAFRASPDISEGAFEPAVEAQLLRIIQEALSNARKHAHAGCVAVTIESEGGLARVTIEDDGCGFDLQQRLSDSGTHVGLRVMRERASETGGALEAESAEGHGTRIVVTAPLRKNGNSGSMQERLTMRVLLVDDHGLFLEGLRNLLTAHGIEVVGMARDGLDALAAARRWRPDLILMDIQMPRCDGVAATRLIKAEMPECKIVMLTMSDDESDLFEAVKSGASGYLLKRLDADEFFAYLEDLQAGHPPFSPGLADKILRAFAGSAAGLPALPASGPPAPAGSTPAPEALSCPHRQLQILTLVGAGPNLQAGGRHDRHRRADGEVSHGRNPRAPAPGKQVTGDRVRGPDGPGAARSRRGRGGVESFPDAPAREIALKDSPSI